MVQLIVSVKRGGPLEICKETRGNCKRDPICSSRSETRISVE
jgi:hypothetical protein